MSRWALIQNSIVVTIVEQPTIPGMPGFSAVDVSARPDVSAGYRFDGQAFTAPAVARRITRFAFRSRFTLSERAAIEFAAVDDPAAGTQARQTAAMLRAYLRDMQDASFVDLSRADVAAGLQQLEALGLIAPGRATQILTAPIESEEIA